MKRRFIKSTAIFLGLLFVFVFFISPLFIGLYAKYEIANVINETSSPYAIRATVYSYRWGWFSSNLKIKIWFANPAATTLTGDVTVYNGPFILFNDWRGGMHWYFNWFAAKGNLALKDKHLNKYIENELPHQIFFAVRQDLALNTNIHIHSPEALLNVNKKRILVGGLTFRLFHSAQHNHIIIHSLLNDAKFDFPDEKTRIDLQYASFSLNIRKDATGLWTGTSNIFIPKAFLYDRAGTAEFDHTHFSTQTDLNDAKHYFDLNLKTQHIKMNQETAGPLKITGFIRHFYDNDLGNFIQIQKYITELNLPKALRHEALNPFIIQLAQGVSAHIQKAELKTEHGNIVAGFSLRLPNVDLDTRPLPTLQTLVKNSMAEFKLFAPSLTLKQHTILGRTLQQLFNQGWLIKAGNEYIMHVQYTPQGYLMNGKPWLVSDKALKKVTDK